MAKEIERIEIVSTEQWRDWLVDHFDRSESVWIIYFNQQSGDDYVQYEALVNTALSFGWIDVAQRRVDEKRSKLLVAPINKDTPWIAINKARVQRLIEDDHMMQPGLDKIEESKKSGSWDRYDEIEKEIEPLDFKKALKNKIGARQHWNKFPHQIKRNILWWIKSASKPETRKKRIEKAVNEAALNRVVNHSN